PGRADQERDRRGPCEARGPGRVPQVAEEPTAALPAVPPREVPRREPGPVRDPARGPAAQVDPMARAPVGRGGRVVTEPRVAVGHKAALGKAPLRAWPLSLPPPVGWRVAFLMYSGGEVVGVSTFGRPVARAEDQVATMEHTRMALGPAAPKNSASWFMARCRAWIRRNMPSVRRLISYVDETRHTGVTYRADHWATVYSRRRKVQSWGIRLGRTGTKARLRTKFERPP